MKNKKKIITYIGILVSVVIVCFMISEFIKNFKDIYIYIQNINSSVFILSVIIYAIAFLLTGYNWAYILWKMDDSVSIKEYLNIHMVSALARYIPGGIWNIVGKAYLCKEKGADKSSITISMTLEYVFQIVSSGIFILMYFLFKFENITNIFIVLILTIITLLILPYGVSIGTKIISKIFKENCESIILKRKYIYIVTLKYIFSWLVTGFGLVILVSSFKEMQIVQNIRLILSYPISWVIGFLSPSPNGMGVREGVLSTLLGNSFPYELLLLISLMTRIWTMLGEILAFVGFKLFYMLLAKNSKADNFKDKDVLFITTKNLDYIRNSQEINLLKQKYKNIQIIGLNSSSYLKRILYVYFKILITSTNKFSIIFIGFAPQLIIPIWKWKFNKNIVVIDFFISLYDTFVFDRKKVKEDTLTAKLLKKIDTYTINSADKVICDTQAHGKYFVDEFNLNPEKLKVLYLEADKTIYNECKIEKPEKYKDKFVVLYFGSILPLQGIDIVIESAKQLSYNKEIHFIIIGPIKKEVKNFESDTITYIEWLDQNELAKYIAFSDLCLAGHFNKNINKAKRTIPGKAYIYNAMKKPMILGDNTATRELYNENMDGVYFVEMGNGKKLSDKINQIYANSNKNQF